MSAADSALGALVWTLLLVVLRTLPVAVALPIFGGPRGTPAVRGAVALVLAMAAWPATLVQQPPAGAGGALGTVDALSVAASQLGFGLLVALGVLFAFEAARMIGNASDTALGRGSFGAADPLSGNGGPLGTLYALGFVAFFFASGAHRTVVAALAASQTHFPLDATLDGESLAVLVDTATRALAASFGLALALALPALGVGLVVDMSLGWLSRVMPKVPALFLAMPLRMVLGWVVVAAVLAASFDALLSLVLAALGALTGAPA